MKYIEELSSGSLFLFQNKIYVLGSDFKVRDTISKRMCIEVENGFIRWIPSIEIVECLNLYFRDKDGNILPIKEFKSDQNLF